MKNIGIHILFLIVLSPYLYSQTTALTVGTGVVCPDEEVLVPIDVTDFIDIGAFTIFIGYDTTVLTFIEHLNENTETQGIYSNAMVTPSAQIGISWSSFNSASISSGKLLDLKFHYHTESCSLNFNQGCELVNSSLEVVDFTSTNGSILQSDPVITQHPLDVMIDEGDNATFSVYASEVSSYQWQISEDQGMTWNDISNNIQFEGVNSSTLTINTVSLEMNENEIRCYLCYENCCIYSEPAFLSVNQLSVYHQYESTNNKMLTVYPNPCSTYAVLSCNIYSKGQLIVKIYDYLGNYYPLVDKVVEAGKCDFEIDISSFKHGIYFCSYELINSSERQICIKKLIKNGIDNW